MSLITKLFGTYSDHQIKKIRPLLAQINALAPKYSAMSDAEMAEMTDKFKHSLAGVSTLDDILPDAYALVREAADRVLGKRPFDVQVLCGILLHQGRIAEMKTGEGKTLVAALPSYLNALSGKGVHVVTVNEYLARLGCEEMGRIHEFLGLKTGLILQGQNHTLKQHAYNCDITYGTNTEFGFDYLRDNMVLYKEQLVQRGHNFAIVDEVDSILIDEARTPLIISGTGEKTNELYDRADSFVRTLSKFVIRELDNKEDHDEINADYIVDEKARSTTLTASGIAKAEKFFGLENFSDPENAEISHHIYQAIRAYGVMKRDIDYVVKDDEVLIVDTFTGRISPGRRFSDGLHQAIEAKEKVKIQKENRTIATITYQNYFRMYSKLSGMTGTALSEENEFREIYNLDVVEVPTNKPMIRVDHPDVVYKSKEGKDAAIIKQIRECHEKGQPVLVGTVSIEKSEELSRKLKLNGIKHTVLNAKYHDREADIVAQAGKLGAVTISTNMAGRGTDILLGGNAEYLAKAEMRFQGYEEDVIALATGSSQSISEEAMSARKVYCELYEKYQEEIKPEAEKVCAAGGLFVIGTERHESRRIDNQLRGRSGRQGDPGESRFFLSFDDDLMRLFGSERIRGIVDKLGLQEDEPIDAKIISGSIESAQKRLEDNNFARRKNVLAYDDVMNQQRSLIYKQRSEVLDGGSMQAKIQSMLHETINEAVDQCLHEEDITLWNVDGLRAKYRGLLCGDDDFQNIGGDPAEARQQIRDTLIERAEKLYDFKEQLFGEEQFREVERVVLLRNVDQKWMAHLEAMDSLMESIGLQAYAQRNPISEYRIQGADLFDEMIGEIRDDTVRMMLSVMPKTQNVQRVQVVKESGNNAAPAAPARGPVMRPSAPARAPQNAAEAKTPAPNRPVVNKNKVGRNDPCPCGSGKKYKKCCGRSDASEDGEE
ncbi:MAG: preprotein translocase subunit SecA [Ruminococcaceae bacterium]|nr:preprotein translocase subunit SecA [Oscillospiraceae bacterium]